MLVFGLVLVLVSRARNSDSCLYRNILVFSRGPAGLWLLVDPSPAGREWVKEPLVLGTDTSHPPLDLHTLATVP